MKLTFLFQPNIFLSKRTKAIVVITIAITVLEILVTGVTANLVCALGWMTCAGTSIDVILCCQLLSNPFPGSRGWLLSRKLRSGGCKIGSSPFLFFLPGLCYHSSIVRNISSVSFQLTSSRWTFAINQLLDRLIVSTRNDTSVCMFVLDLKRTTSSVFFRSCAEYPTQIESDTNGCCYAVRIEKLLQVW